MTIPSLDWLDEEIADLEESTSLADLLKASFGGDRSEAGRYAANVRWQGQAKKEISQKVTIGSKSRDAESGTVWATDKETGKVIGALSFDGYFISKVYVRPEHQRKGVASYLYKEAKKRNGGVEMRADDYTVSGAGFMSAMTGRDVFQSGDYSSAGRLWETWLNELEKETIEKASFGGDRSEAGRYAANIRWQGNVKGEEKVVGFIGKTKYPVTADGAKHPRALMKEMQKEASSLIPRGESKSIQARAKSAKAMVCKNLSEAMSEISTDDIKRAYREVIMGVPSLENLNETATREDWVSSFVGAWATTSNDGDEMSLAIQDTAAKLFGLDKALSWSRVDSLAGEVRETKNYQPTMEPFSPATQKVLDAFVQAQYNATQQYFEEKGIKSLTVFRGMHFENKGEMDRAGFEELGDTWEEDGTVVRQRPLSAWSLDYEQAQGFAKYDNRRGGDSLGVMIKTRVPVSQIFSTPLTGVGCLNENEVVVMSNPKSISYDGGQDADFIYLPEGTSVIARLLNWEEKGEPAPEPKDS